MLCFQNDKCIAAKIILAMLNICSTNKICHVFYELIIKSFKVVYSNYFMFLDHSKYSSNYDKLLMFYLMYFKAFFF